MNPTYYSAVTTLINYIASSCTAHTLVSSFGCGENDEVGVNGNDLYPRCFLELPLVANYSNNKIEWNLVLTVMDIQLKDLADQVEKLSLCFDISNDLFQKFKTDGIYYLTDEYNSTSITEYNDDFTAAIRTEFIFTQPIPMDKCNISNRFNS